MSPNPLSQRGGVEVFLVNIDIPFGFSSLYSEGSSLACRLLTVLIESGIKMPHGKAEKRELKKIQNEEKILAAAARSYTKISAGEEEEGGGLVRASAGGAATASASARRFNEDDALSSSSSAYRTQQI